MHIIGDIHGKFDKYFGALKYFNIESSIQIGDMGIGFPKHRFLEKWNLNHRFIRGNHDNPEIIKNHPNFLGDFGFLQKENIYYISGGYSIDYKQRTIGYDWWKDEELSKENFKIVKSEISKHKPKIIISHDGPLSVIKKMFSYPNYFQNKTTVNLDVILSKFQPEMWIFGHHHRSTQLKINNTLFICLQELEILNLKGN